MRIFFTLSLLLCSVLSLGNAQYHPHYAATAIPADEYTVMAVESEPLSEATYMTPDTTHLLVEPDLPRQHEREFITQQFIGQYTHTGQYR